MSHTTRRTAMKSLILKRSIIIARQKTSVSLENEFWQALKQIAAGLDMPMAELVHQIGRQREYGNLSSALRLYVLEHYLGRARGRRDGEAAQEAVQKVVQESAQESDQEAAQESAPGSAHESLQEPAPGKVCSPT